MYSSTQEQRLRVTASPPPRSGIPVRRRPAARRKPIATSDLPVPLLISRLLRADLNGTRDLSPCQPQSWARDCLAISIRPSQRLLDDALLFLAALPRPTVWRALAAAVGGCMHALGVQLSGPPAHSVFHSHACDRADEEGIVALHGGRQHGDPEQPTARQVATEVRVERRYERWVRLLRRELREEAPPLEAQSMKGRKGGKEKKGGKKACQKKKIGGR